VGDWVGECGMNDAVRMLVWILNKANTNNIHHEIPNCVFLVQHVRVCLDISTSCRSRYLVPQFALLHRPARITVPSPPTQSIYSTSKESHVFMQQERRQTMPLLALITEHTRLINFTKKFGNKELYT
jgi:hypothetical protein